MSYDPKNKRLSWHKRGFAKTCAFAREGLPKMFEVYTKDGPTGEQVCVVGSGETYIKFVLKEDLDESDPMVYHCKISTLAGGLPTPSGVSGGRPPCPGWLEDNGERLAGPTVRVAGIRQNEYICAPLKKKD